MDRRDLLKAGVAGIGAMVFTSPVRAVERLMAPGKTWAVLYGTECGSSRDAANWINEGLGGIADVLDVATGPDVGDYENVIIGGPIQAGQLINPVKSFITNNKAVLQPKIQGLFTLCGNSGNPTISESRVKSYLTDQIVQLSGVADKPAKLFPGRSTPDCGGMTYDNLKQADCEAFGREVLNVSVNAVRPNVPHAFELCQNNPDPFHSVTTITYSIPKAVRVTVAVCALNGQTVTTLVSGFKAAGTHTVKWDARSLPPGYYLFRLQAGGFSAIHKARKVGY
ncbi:MAG: hypothetical protein JW768_08165 [Chitinispirillaceae bacterium]|nr:hypothetical protein [Chitinispirillaceae bacterium]